MKIIAVTMIIIKQSATPQSKFPLRANPQKAQGLLKKDEAPMIRAEEISSIAYSVAQDAAADRGWDI